MEASTSESSSRGATRSLQKMLVSPQAERNWESLSLVLEEVLENQSHRQLSALELGSGTGQHVIRFAQKMPFVTWQPSDIKEESLERSALVAAAHSAHSTRAASFLQQSAGADGRTRAQGVKRSRALLAASRRTLPRRTPRTCCSRCTWTPASRASSGQVSRGIPAMRSWPLTCCSTAPSKRHRSGGGVDSHHAPNEPEPEPS